MKTQCHLPAGSRGFTLLEMTMVLFVAALFIGVAAFSFQGLSDERTLRTPAAELQRMAREAVTRAGLYEQAETIVFEPGGFGIRYRADASVTANPGDKQYWLRRVQTPPDMRVLLKRWGSTEFHPAAGQNWMILPGGICEPVVVRFEWKKSSVQMLFHPLTGSVADEITSISP